jgi:hypothetical protein
MLLRRLDATITVHGFRSSYRDWAAGVEFSAAEQCLAHAIGGNVTPLLFAHLDAGTQRPVLASWRHLSAARRRQRGRASHDRGVIPVETSLRVMKPRAVGDRRGAGALEATIAMRHDDASPHKWGGGREHGHCRWKRR